MEKTPSNPVRDRLTFADNEFNSLRRGIDIEQDINPVSQFRFDNEERRAFIFDHMVLAGLYIDTQAERPAGAFEEPQASPGPINFFIEQSFQFNLGIFSNLEHGCPSLIKIPVRYLHCTKPFHTCKWNFSNNYSGSQVVFLHSTMTNIRSINFLYGTIVLYLMRQPASRMKSKENTGTRTPVPGVSLAQI